MFSKPRLLLSLAIALATTLNLSAQMGQDVAAVFQRAKEGAPLRYVALGGSITQAGKGWIGPWLREQFPESDVTSVNSGMSATGSALGVFRVDRDVIAHQPDLVAIEYCVNDGGASDEDAIRNMESLIVRLKSLRNPPAIIILEAAAKGGVNLKRHRKVAQHYDLLEVDLQKAVDTELAATDAPWESLFSDAVHPIAPGHVLYAKAIAETLTPCLSMTDAKMPDGLPKPMSSKPLVLDGRMVPLSGYSDVEDWSTLNSLPKWWNRFFHGVQHSEKPGAVLDIPFRGTRIGLYAAMDPSYGSFYASVDGHAPEHVFTNTRGGYLYKTLAQDLEAKEHRLTIVLPAESDPETRMNGPVNLGYLLLAGESEASREPSPQGPMNPEMLAHLNFETIALDDWEWAGPYRLTTTAKDALPLLDVSFAPELSPETVVWNSDGQARNEFDFRGLFDLSEPAVAYVRGELEREADGAALLGVQVDYFAKVWINCVLVADIDSGHGSPKGYVYLPVALKSGINSVLVKVAAGSEGHKMGLVLASLDGPTEAFMSTANENEVDVSKRPKPTYANVPYGTDERNVMDVWLADSSQPTPCVIHIHGGGWLGGDKSKVADPQRFLDAGISYIAINYRFLLQTIIDTGSERGTAPIQPRGDYTKPPVDVPLYDAARALQFVRHQAGEWNIDKARIGLTGGSAGACSSLWLTFHDDLADPDAKDPILRESTRVWCASVEVAQTTLDPQQTLEWIPNATYGGHAFGYLWDRSDPTLEIRSFLADRENVMDWIKEYSPYELVTENDPPVYLFYRDTPGKGKEQKDPTHTSTYGALLIEKLEAKGVDYTFMHGGVEDPEFKDCEAYLIHQLKK